MFDRPRQRRAPTTRWTIFKQARSSDPETASRAVAQLCEQYIGPLYSHFRDRGEPSERAEDLAQGFIAELIATDGFARIIQGSARAYLWKAADHFAKDDRKARNRLKRGGGATHVSLDTTDVEERYSPADDSLSPEEAWNMRWAEGVLERVFARIHADLVEDKQADRWPWLEFLLRNDSPSGFYAELSARTGKREGALRSWVWRMRLRAEEYIREELKDQVDLSDPAEADANIAAERERLEAAGLRVGQDPPAEDDEDDG